ncbi:MAG: hypothetical protein ACPG5T_10235, partial [Endozoicomonas sp.]
VNKPTNRQGQLSLEHREPKHQNTQIFDKSAPTNARAVSTCVVLIHQRGACPFSQGANRAFSPFLENAFLEKKPAQNRLQ